MNGGRRGGGVELAGWEGGGWCGERSGAPRFQMSFGQIFPFAGKSLIRTCIYKSKCRKKSSNLSSYLSVFGW